MNDLRGHFSVYVCLITAFPRSLTTNVLQVLYLSGVVVQTI